MRNRDRVAGWILQQQAEQLCPIRDLQQLGCHRLYLPRIYPVLCIGCVQAAGFPLPMATFTLVSSPICPFAQRAWLTALELGVAFELKETSLTDKPTWFSELYATAVGAEPTSNGKVPILVHGDLVLAESAVVAQYLVDTFGASAPADTALGPASFSPALRARTQIFLEQVVSKVVKGFYALLMAQGAEAREKGLAELLAAMRVLNGALSRSGGPFFAGAHLSLADVLVYPWLARFNVLAHYRAFSLPNTPDFAAVHAFIAAMRARPSVAASAREDVWIAGYEHYANPAPAAAAGAAAK